NRYATGYPPGTDRLSIVGNWLVTTLANLLYGLRVRDLSCGYKLMPTAIAQQLALRSTGFEIEAELVAKLAKKGVSILNAPVRYSPRTLSEGKKIHWRDAFRLVFQLLHDRLPYS